ncbi:MAG: NAD(P)H-dependent oxidoreductase subunit E [Candidatus Brocadiia bacterium]|nr:NAD(P)H-dependent oxidoreductase subunit E [Candidatus Brocadiia bacterium]
MPVVEADLTVAKADEVLEGYGLERNSLIHVLQDVQNEFDYLPREAIRRVSERLELPLAEVLRVATFYAAFSLEPQGRHLISVCMGTACHVRGAPRILDSIARTLGLEEGERNTADMKFTVKSVRCLGCCGLAPVITVGDDTHGLLKPGQIPEILKKYD